MVWRINLDPSAEKELRKIGREPAHRDYRLIADIRDGELTILVVRIGNRREVYRL